MRLVTQVKLHPSSEQKGMLDRTLRAANAACEYVGQVAWDAKVFRRFALHRYCYREIRTRFNLGAQLAVRVIAKVADAYRLERKVQRTFRVRGSVAFDRRNLSWNPADRAISIWTVGGRQRIGYRCGARQAAMLIHQRGESDLVYRDGAFYLYATCELPDGQMTAPAGFLGIDMGLKNIAFDSDGTRYRGNHALSLRHRHRRLRRRLQAKRTKSAKRLLRMRSRKESRFMTDVNHCVSKQLVTTA